MATQRKSTGSSPLLDMMKEVYETKLRMKKVINMVLDSNSDDFEEYSTLAYNALATKYNEGVRDGYNDGYHTLFPEVQLEEDDWSEYYKEFQTFTPSVPTYSTDVDVDNLTVMMTDSLRCRLLLKAALETNSDEFVTYPDILESLYDTWYETAYNDAYEQGVEDATESLYIPPTIEQSAWGETITITNNADFGDVYYWFGDDSMNKTLYTEPFTIDETCTINAALFYNNRWSRITTKLCLYYLETEFGYEILEDVNDIRLYVGRGFYGNVNEPQYNSPNLYYRINNGEWNNCNYAIANVKLKDVYIDNISLHKGDIIQLQIQSTYIQPTGHGDSIVIKPACYKNGREVHRLKYNVIGNIFSLISTNPFSSSSWYSNLYGSKLNYFWFDDGDRTEYHYNGLYSAFHLVLPVMNLENFRWTGLFNGCTSLEIPPILPATTLAKGCYSGMFEYCTSLVNAPELPATVMPDYPNPAVGEGSYESMFIGCTSLLNAPELPATTLARACYRGMFAGCTSLVNAPTLPATTITEFCYYDMFAGCTSLVNAPTLPATTLPNCCYYEMFKGCTSLVNPPLINNELIFVDRRAFYHMFEGCTSLQRGINISGDIILDRNSYAHDERLYEMYKGCSSLQYIKCTWHNSETNTFKVFTDYYYGGGLPNTGTFVKDANTYWMDIPSGWTVQDAA